MAKGHLDIKLRRNRSTNQTKFYVKYSKEGRLKFCVNGSCHMTDRLISVKFRIPFKIISARMIWANQ